METILYHKFSEAGLGDAPFTFTGCRENVLRHANGHIQPGGSCDYCGTGIRYEFHIVSACGKTSKVGCECIRRVGDHKLLTAAEYAKKKLDRAKRAQVRHEKAEAILKAQREQNGGLTDWEVQQQAEREQEARQREIGQRWASEASRLRDGQHGFRDSVADQLEAGRLPVGRGLSITIDILAKQKGRSGSSAYEAEADRLDGLFQ